MTEGETAQLRSTGDCAAHSLHSDADERQGWNGMTGCTDNGWYRGLYDRESSHQGEITHEIIMGCSSKPRTSLARACMYVMCTALCKAVCASDKTSGLQYRWRMR